MRSNLFAILLIATILALVSCSGSGKPAPITQPSPSLSATFDPSATPSPTFTPTPKPTLTLIVSATPTFRITLAAVGDIMLARSVGDQILAKGPQIVFSSVQAALASADVRVGNLECAITNRDTPEKKSFPLKAPFQAAKALSLAEFNILSLANNHSMDFGFSGLTDTQDLLAQYGIASVGAGADASEAHAPVYIQKNGLLLAFLAYADVMPENSGFDARIWAAGPTKPGIAWADPEQIKMDVASAKLHSDLVVVLLHSGYEINSTVSANQRMEAQTAIDAGASLVLGSHPHILQPIEEYHGGLIAYSLGNFVFDDYEGIVNASIILNVVLNRSGVVRYDYIPILIENGLPVITSIEKVRGVETLVAP